MNQILVEFHGATNFKQYISSSKAARFKGSSLEVETRYGYVKFDFSMFDQATSCAFRARRLGGNGGVAVIAGNYAKDIEVLSKSYEYISIDLAWSKIIEIKRPPQSNGNIEIVGINLYTDDPVITTDEDMATNWRAILNNLNDFKHLRVVKDRLFAAEGAYIKCDEVMEVQTHPPRAYTVNGTEIKFARNCEILALSVASTPRDRSLNIPHFTAPPQVSQPAQAQAMQELEAHQKVLSNIPLPNKYNPYGNKVEILYDSISDNLYARKNNDVKSADGNAVILGRRGAAIVHMSSIKPDKNYIVILHISKMNGNGKVSAHIEPMDNTSAALGFANPGLNYMYLNVKSGSPRPNEPYKLVVGRPDSATGEVLIRRIMLICGLEIDASRQLSVGIRPSGSVGARVVGSFIYSGVSYIIDDVHLNLKSYCNFSDKFESNLSYDKVSGTLLVKSLSGMSWYNKVKSSFPYVHMFNEVSDSQHATLLGDIGALVPAKSVYLNEFGDDVFSERDHEVLKDMRIIFTPSQSNLDVLRSMYPDKDVRLALKGWPIINTTPIPYITGDYIAVIDRNPSTTAQVLKAYDILRATNANLPKLVVIGGRGEYPKDVIVTNEYLSYPKLLHILLNARCVFDIPVMTDYMSSIIHLLYSAGIPVASSNWFILNKDNCLFLISDQKEGGNYIPSIENVASAFSDILDMNKIKRNTMKYNDVTFDFLRQIV